MLIVSPNLGTDRILEIEALRPGEVLRFTRSTIIAGGKGVNVARVAQRLHAPALLIGFAGGHGGHAVAGLLADERLPCALVPAAGEARAMSIITEASGRVTVLNEPGPTITPEEWAALERAVQAHFAAHRLLVCIGSVPLGSPVDGYARLVRLAHAQGLRVVVDATGGLLEAALGAQPDVVTPNLFEATATLQGAHSAELVEGIERETLRRRAAVAAVELRRRGAGTAIVTAGKAGAAVATHAGVRWIAAPAVREVNPIGAGDAFVGGLAGALEEGQSLEMAAIAGTASAAASVETPLPGHLDPARAGALRSHIQIEALQHAARGDVNGDVK